MEKCHSNNNHKRSQYFLGLYHLKCDCTLPRWDRQQHQSSGYGSKPQQGRRSRNWKSIINKPVKGTVVSDYWGIPHSFMAVYNIGMNFYARLPSQFKTKQTHSKTANVFKYFYSGKRINWSPVLKLELMNSYTT